METRKNTLETDPLVDLWGYDFKCKKTPYPADKKIKGWSDG